MAIKKSDLYSSLWASCDELRGGMDASQYKDYVLFMLFIKYVSNKYGDSDDFAPPVIIPKGASFKDMIALKGDSDIGNKINTQVIQPLIDANFVVYFVRAVARCNAVFSNFFGYGMPGGFVLVRTYKTGMRGALVWHDASDINRSRW